MEQTGEATRAFGITGFECPVAAWLLGLALQGAIAFGP
jgi:hypothetical protein